VLKKACKKKKRFKNRQFMTTSAIPSTERKQTKYQLTLELYSGLRL
jgi:hypothetical protein